jgi:uncharacterized membrane protein
MGARNGSIHGFVEGMAGGLVGPGRSLVLVKIGIILLAIGVILWILGRMGRPVGGRMHYY